MKNTKIEISLEDLLKLINEGKTVDVRDYIMADEQIIELLIKTICYN